MSADLTLFFPPGTRVLALPGWRNPRLYLPMQAPLRSWEQSSLYPAFRPRARLYRSLLRLRASVGLANARTVRSSSWPLAEFCEAVLPQLTSAVVLVGTPGPAQGITVQLWDEKGRVLGYLKYVEKKAARFRLERERSVLRNLPSGIGPEPMKLGPLGRGEALLKSAIPGKTLTTTLPPLRDSIRLMDTLTVVGPVSLETHPWVLCMRERGAPVDWFEPLAGRRWPVVIQHGDFAPWNLLKDLDGVVRAIDWEYGTLEGFPYLDLIYYLLQTSALIHRHSPLEAARRAAGYLTGQPSFALSAAEARALVRLAAYDAYQGSSESGELSGRALQAWRRAIWEGAACDA